LNITFKLKNAIIVLCTGRF